MRWDLNCDLGENEPRRRTAALMRVVSSASIACGGHAGSLATMRACVRLALKHGVKVGAHPGLPDRHGFGRAAGPVSASFFQTLVLQQVSALERIARAEGAALHHIKLHGALYHLAEKERPLRRAWIALAGEFWPDTVLYCLAGGAMAREGAALGLRMWREGFLDRGYDQAGRLIPRGRPGALLNRSQFEARLAALATDLAAPGTLPRAETWCVHADSPDALWMARRARSVFEKALIPSVGVGLPINQAL